MLPNRLQRKVVHFAFVGAVALEAGGELIRSSVHLEICVQRDWQQSLRLHERLHEGIF
jgi:hypothetical protein